MRTTQAFPGRLTDPIAIVVTGRPRRTDQKDESKQGQSVALCSFCESMKELDKAGAKHQEIKTSTGAIGLVTSTDPEVVKKIHAQADKAMAEQKKLTNENSTR